MNFFDSEKKQKELLQILESWMGTPYRHRTAVKGRGVDCIHFVACVMMEAGVISKFNVPDYPSDWHLHHTDELLREGIAQFPMSEEFDPGEVDPINGDILLFRYGRASAHSTIFFDNYIYQAVGYDEVRKNSLKLLKDEGRLTTGFRVKML